MLLKYFKLQTSQPVFTVIDTIGIIVPLAENLNLMLYIIHDIITVKILTTKFCCWDLCQYQQLCYSDPYLGLSGTSMLKNPSIHCKRHTKHLQVLSFWMDSPIPTLDRNPQTMALSPDFLLPCLSAHHPWMKTITNNTKKK